MNLLLVFFTPPYYCILLPFNCDLVVGFEGHSSEPVTSFGMLKGQDISSAGKVIAALFLYAIFKAQPLDHSQRAHSNEDALSSHAGHPELDFRHRQQLLFYDSDGDITISHSHSCQSFAIGNDIFICFEVVAEHDLLTGRFLEEGSNRSVGNHLGVLLVECVKTLNPAIDRFNTDYLIVYV